MHLKLFFYRLESRSRALVQAERSDPTLHLGEITRCVSCQSMSIPERIFPETVNWDGLNRWNSCWVLKRCLVLVVGTPEAGHFLCWSSGRALENQWASYPTSSDLSERGFNSRSSRRSPSIPWSFFFPCSHTTPHLPHVFLIEFALQHPKTPVIFSLCSMCIFFFSSPSCLRSWRQPSSCPAPPWCPSSPGAFCRLLYHWIPHDHTKFKIHTAACAEGARAFGFTTTTGSPWKSKTSGLRECSRYYRNIPNSVPGACHFVSSSRESRNSKPIHLAPIHRRNRKCIYLKKLWLSIVYITT